MRRCLGITALFGFASLGAAAPLHAQELVQFAANDGGDTAWIMAASAIALLAALPGLALHYAGRGPVRTATSVAIQVGAIAAAVSLGWIVLGYTLAFGPVTVGWLGNHAHLMLANLGNVRVGTLLPESAFVLFQMIFAIIAACLMTGSWIGRARFGWAVGFAALWAVVVHAPVTHWLWGGGWIARTLGVLDFAGGLTMHVTAGVSALVVALLLGRRAAVPSGGEAESRPALGLIGAAMMWIGWLALSGGSALAATDDASTAILSAHVAACTSALCWLALERFATGRTTAGGLALGLLAGLAAIAPASGFVSPGASVIFGVAAAIVCRGALSLVSDKLGVDDTLGVFAIHGVGAMVGAILLGVFLSETLGGVGYAEGMTMGSQVIAQLIGTAAVALWSAIATAIIALMISLIVPMRVSEDEERAGLDTACHREPAG
ncbi:ammonium transporter [Pelagerythrobacter marensis]|uniref:Ammonium transporter n=1 Tax=Pelagerythrobacter marensis TaxID=543877 RepID=A0A0G3XAF9_9SPHN|nr:ammonium transporter [Pelagerythrobacter marensis]AKM07388.1 Ammonium transporter [Pelagerythrobacter marensis]